MLTGENVAAVRRWGAESPSGRLRAVALCEPRFFDISCAINDWHRQYVGRREVDRSEALRQFANLVLLFGSLGIETHFIEPQPGCPYQVFTRDTCIVLNSGAIMTEPSTSVRRQEVHATRNLMARLGIPVVDEVKGEGGDVVFTSHKSVAIATSRRTQSDALADALARHSVGLRVDQVTHESSTHLDTVFAVIDSSTCVVTMEGMTDPLQNMIEKTFATIIRFDRQTLETVANNFLVVGPRSIVASTSAHAENELLASRGIEVHELDLSQFNLSGAGPRCMTLEVFREEP